MRNESGIDITLHVAAMALRGKSVKQIVEKTGRLEQGLPVDGVIDTARGY